MNKKLSTIVLKFNFIISVSSGYRQTEYKFPTCIMPCSLAASMTTSLIYIPDFGITLNSIPINWLTKRDDVRKLISLPFKEMDTNIGLGDNQTIESKRDVYHNVNGGDNYFFLNYNSDNALIEIEVHWGVDILVKDVALNFKKHIQDNVSAIKKLTDNFKEIEPGSYLFSDLKLSISDAESCGANGNELSYFYASIDVSHLEA